MLHSEFEADLGYLRLKAGKRREDSSRPGALFHSEPSPNITVSPLFGGYINSHKSQPFLSNLKASCCPLACGARALSCAWPQEAGGHLTCRPWLSPPSWASWRQLPPSPVRWWWPALGRSMALRPRLDLLLQALWVYLVLLSLATFPGHSRC